ncbi:MAG: choice-of-anchor L domain-containing protein, partial [Bernardetiaceae bacterium]|nr:choice-of-anchor L domain-containing protein [Bernardetiaceae bacterium]
MLYITTLISTAEAQIVVNTGITPAEIISRLEGVGVTVSNVTIICDDRAYGSFDRTGITPDIGAIGLGASGIILTTGDAGEVPNPSTFFASSINSTGTDPDLVALSGVNINDACVIAFDIVPAGDTIKFNYTFGSEEYPNFAPPIGAGTLNDAFGFFIQDLTAGTPKENIALIPGTTTAVSILNLNPVTNAGFYYNNMATGPNGVGPSIAYNGLSAGLIAIYDVTPCNTYRIELKIGDGGDSSFDSGVFIERVTSTELNIDTDLTIGWVECDEPPFFNITRDSANIPETVYFQYGGSAVTNGVVNILNYPDSTTLITGQNEFLFSLDTLSALNYSNIATGGLDTLLIFVLDACGNQIDVVDIYFLDSLDIGPRNIVLCEGESYKFGTHEFFDTYLWSDGSTSDSLTYTATTSGTIDTLFLEVTLVNSADGTICEAVDTVFIEVKAEAPIDIGENQIACVDEGAFTLDAAEPTHTPAVTYAWFENGVLMPGETNATLEVFFDPPAPNSETRQYIVEVEDTGVCPSRDTVYITFNPLPIVALGADTTLCDSQGNLIIGTDDATHGTTMSYEWQMDSLGIITTIAGANGPTLEVTHRSESNMPMTIDYILTVTNDTSLCVNSDVISVTYTPNPILDLGDDLVRCDSEGDVVISAEDPTHAGVMDYEWFKDSVGTVTPLSEITAELTVTHRSIDSVTANPIDYIVVVTNQITGCTSSDTVRVTYNPNPFVEITLGGVAQDIYEFCDTDGEQTFSAYHPSHQANMTYQWFDITDPGAPIDLGTDTVITVENLSASTIYEVIVTNVSEPTNCPTRDTVEVIFHTNPEAQILFAGAPTNEISFCNSEGEQTFTALAPSHDANTTYQWSDITDPTNIVALGSDAEITLENLSQTRIYEVLITDTNFITNCTTRDTLELTFRPNPTLDITLDGAAEDSYDFCDSDGAQTLDASDASHDAGFTYQWRDITAAPIDLGTDATQVVDNFSETRVYEVIVNDDNFPNSCESRDTVTVTFNPNPTLEITYLGNPETAVSFCDSEGAQTVSAAHPSHTADFAYEWVNLTTGAVVGTDADLEVSNFNSTVVYEVTVTDNSAATACQTVADISVTFNPNPVAEIKIDGIADTEYNFCDNDAPKTLDASDASHTADFTYEWTNLTTGVVVGTDATLEVSAVSEVNEYQVLITDTSTPNNCESTTSVTVGFYPEAEVEIQYDGAAAAAEYNFCDAEGAQTFSGLLPSHTADFVYEWTKPDGTVVSNTADFVADEFSASNTYILTVYDGSAPLVCESTDEITINFYPTPVTEIKHNGTVKTEELFCNSDGAQTLNAGDASHAVFGGDITYQWRDITNGVDLGTNPIQETRIENFAPAGGAPVTIIYEVTIGNTLAGCENTAQIEITFHPEPLEDRPVAISDTEFCDEGTATVTISDPQNGVLYELYRNGTKVDESVAVGGTDLEFDNFVNTNLVSGQSTYTYTIRAIDINYPTECEIWLDESVEVVVYPLPTFRIEGTTTICDDETTNVGFFVTGNFPINLTFQYTSQTGVVTVTDTVVNSGTFVYNVSGGSYEPIAVSDVNGCVGTPTGEAIITVEATPDVTLAADDPDLTICRGETVTFTAGGADIYTFFLNGVPVQVAEGNTYTSPVTLDPGEYEFYVRGMTTIANCTSDSDPITITVNPIPQAYIGVPTRFVCEDVPVVFEAVVTNGLDGDNFIYDWQRLNEDGTSSPVGVGEPTLSVSDTGRYFVIITDAGSPTLCQSVSNTVTVRPFGDIPLSLGEDVQPVCDPD